MNLQPGTQHRMSDTHLALTRLLRLASPMLPVGAFSYSQGLESAIELGWIRDERSACEWIGDALQFSIAKFEAPVWLRLYAAWETADYERVQHWNALLLASREAGELRAETVQMGYSLRTLISASGEFDTQHLPALMAMEEVAFSTTYTFACAAWCIPAHDALVAYLWSWAENQVSAAMKSVPLGQLAGQRMLAALQNRLPDVVRTASTLQEDDFANSAPGLAIASCLHEVQYSRLFRS
jgi:urease accessory protein